MLQQPKPKALKFEEFYGVIRTNQDIPTLEGILRMLGIKNKIEKNLIIDFCTQQTQDAAKALYDACYPERQREEEELKQAAELKQAEELKQAAELKQAEELKQAAELKRNTVKHEEFKKKLEQEKLQRDTKSKKDLSKPRRDVKKELQQKYQKQAQVYSKKRAEVLQRKAETEQQAQIVLKEFLRMSNINIEVCANQQKPTRYEALCGLFFHYNNLMSPQNKSSPQEKQKAFRRKYPNIPEANVKSIWNSLCYLTGSKAITEAHKAQIKNNEYGILETIWHFIAQILSLGYKSTTYGAKQEINKFGDYLVQNAEKNASGVSF